MDFRESDPTTIGMELEFQLLDASTLDLMDGILPLVDLYPGSLYVKPGFIQNTVEVASKVRASVPELEEHLRGIVTDLKERCQILGMALCGAAPTRLGNAWP